MFHIVFQRNDIAVLNQAMDLDEALDGEVQLIAGDYSLGPLEAVPTAEGRDFRRQWWLGLPAEGIQGSAEFAANDEETIRMLQTRMREEEFDEIWIWVASNQQDVCGYYRILPELKEFCGRVYILSLNNLPFINDKGAVFYPSGLFEIPPREFKKAKRLARPVTVSEFEIDGDEWSRLCAENKGVRVLEGAKKIIQHDYDYFDNAIKKFAGTDFQKPNRIIHSFLLKSSVRVNEAFLHWRLKELVRSGECTEEGGLIKNCNPVIPGCQF
jgi:Domain of unknown function (DUF1835)/Protein of unknown function